MSEFKIVNDHGRIMIHKQHPITGFWRVAGGPFKHRSSACSRKTQLRIADEDEFAAKIARQVMAKHWGEVRFS